MKRVTSGGCSRSVTFGSCGAAGETCEGGEDGARRSRAAEVRGGQNHEQVIPARGWHNLSVSELVQRPGDLQSCGESGEVDRVERVRGVQMEKVARGAHWSNLL